MRLGKLELVARNTPSTKGQLWKITKLNLSNSAAQLRSSGSWLKGFDGGNETNLLINTNINNLGALLNRLDMQNLVKSGNGSINGEFILGRHSPAALTPRASTENEYDRREAKFSRSNRARRQTIVFADTAVFNTLPDP